MKYVSIMKKYFLHSILFLQALLFVSCGTGGIIDNPPPFLEITDGPKENEVLIKDRTTFAWKGNGTDYLFRYRLLYLDSDNFPTVYQDWTSYQKVQEVVFSNLDDGKFAFEIQGKSSNIEPAPLRRTFIVNALTGPTFSFYKTKTSIPVAGQDSVNLWMEDVQNLTAMRMVLAFDRSKLRLVGVSPGAMVTSSNFRQVILPDFSNAAVLAAANAVGRIEVNTALLMDAGTGGNKSLSGSGKLLSFIFSGVTAGSTTLEVTSMDVRTPEGVEVPFTTPKPGIIEVK